MNSLPSISIVIPVYNSEQVLRNCLQSIKSQAYPADKVETIILDGGSTDKTIDIAKEFEVEKILPNRLRTGEAGKAEGLKASVNEIVAFIDSDNILPTEDWLKTMVEPFTDKSIIGSEPLRYTYRKEDGLITRYCALLGMNDPLCLFLGNYDRYSTLTDTWTQMPRKEEDIGSYLKIELDKKKLPTIGANGFFVRRKLLKEYMEVDYLFDIDVIYEILNKNAAGHPIRFAKTKTSIIHTFSGDLKTFARKQRRRVHDYLYYNKLGVRKYPWKSTSQLKLFKFIFYCLTILPLLGQSIKGYRKKPDRAWFFHPLACWITFWEYSKGMIIGAFRVKELKRDGWTQ